MSTDPRPLLSPRLGSRRGVFRPIDTRRASTVRLSGPRARRALWILLGVLLIASLFLAGPAHQVLHHGSDGAGGCDLCHVSMPEAPRFEPIVFWLAAQSVELARVAERVPAHVLPEQGNARAPPAKG
jgi:hypothetical protein